LFYLQFLKIFYIVIADCGHIIARNMLQLDIKLPKIVITPITPITPSQKVLTKDYILPNGKMINE